jgi:hypothetical protein
MSIDGERRNASPLLFHQLAPMKAEASNLIPEALLNSAGRRAPLTPREASVPLEHVGSSGFEMGKRELK